MGIWTERSTEVGIAPLDEAAKTGIEMNEIEMIVAATIAGRATAM